MSQTQTTARRVTLGRTGLEVSPICFGTWQLSPRFWGNVPEDDCVNAMRRAFDLDINFYDTADAYGEGYSEQIVGKALKDLPRDRIVVATKVFHHFHPDGRRYGDLSHDYVIEACEASLRRLQMDTIDLYQCHSYDAMAHPGETAQAMEKLKKQGKIRHYGHSNWTADQIRLGEKFGNFETAQPLYNLLDRDIENHVLPVCQELNIGVLVFSPLRLGLLTGKFKGDETFDDLRKNDPRFQGETFKQLCRNLDEVGRIAQGYNLTTVQFVLAATLMHPAVHCAITGIKRPAQIEESAGAMGKTISREDWCKVRGLLHMP